MGVEWIAGILVALAIACAVGAVILFMGASWLLQWLRGTAGIVLAGIAAWCVLFAASLFGYQQFPPEAPLATVSFEQESPQQWDVTVAEANGDVRRYTLLGDLWQLDVRLLRFAGPLGIPPSFRLERLSGRYLTLEDQQEKDVSEHVLLPEPFLGFDIWQRAHDNGSLLLDATRAAVVLMPAADGAIYEVRMADTGLVVGAGNSVAESALRPARN